MSWIGDRLREVVAHGGSAVDVIKFINNLPTGFLYPTKFSVSGCLHDTGATFAPERVHSGVLSWLYICLHETTTKCMPA